MTLAYNVMLPILHTYCRHEVKKITFVPKYRNLKNARIVFIFYIRRLVVPGGSPILPCSGSTFCSVHGVGFCKGFLTTFLYSKNTTIPMMKTDAIPPPTIRLIFHGLSNPVWFPVLDSVGNVGVDVNTFSLAVV